MTYDISELFGDIVDPRTKFRDGHRDVFLRRFDCGWLCLGFRRCLGRIWFPSQHSMRVVVRIEIVAREYRVVYSAQSRFSLGLLADDWTHQTFRTMLSDRQP